MRVRVPFGPTTRVGVVLERAAESALPRERLKRVLEVLDDCPVMPLESLALLRWASDYYHHPIGDVLQAMLPALLRRGRPARAAGTVIWRISEAGAAMPSGALRRAPRQAQLLDLIRSHSGGVDNEQIRRLAGDTRGALVALYKKGLITRVTVAAACPRADTAMEAVALDPAQTAAVDTVSRHQGSYKAFVLDGITSSGKTEVYLKLIENTLALGRQAMLLIPEIGLTPQMVSRFRARLQSRVVVLHSGLSDRERLDAWLQARDGLASAVIGTRSAVLVPLARPGLFIVDEEHDLSYKQQEGFRYSARDLAVVRARRAGVPVVLGSATPSLESLHNVTRGRYEHLRLPRRAMAAAEPAIRVVDLRGRPYRDGLSSTVVEEIENTLEQDDQVLVFLNRRGYAPVLMCHACGWSAECERCDARMVFHQAAHCLCCHHCGAQAPPPTNCGACAGPDLQPLGLGTQRVGEALKRRFPNARIARVDRDTTNRKGALPGMLDAVHAGDIDILIGTQMLAKGHHFPRVTMVAVLDTDGGLFGVDFRAGERMAQLLVQVSGRAGRGRRPGQVLIQTHHPDHPLLRDLITKGYQCFAESALRERAQAGLPPFASHALLRAESTARDAGAAFLARARSLAEPLIDGSIQVLGPVPAPMERRAGRYRSQLLVEAPVRGSLHRFLERWLPALDSERLARRVRWSLDVDPQEMV